LTVNPDHTATLTCDDGNGNIVFAKAIEYTDFPLPEIALYFTDKTILAPGALLGHRNTAVDAHRRRQSKQVPP
jgi:hypothetical protein